MTTPLAKQHAILSANQLQRLDDRPPVVHLRSFAEERLQISKALFEDKSLLEEVILDNGMLVGPVVAIGQPGDLLPPLGVARDYMPAEAWKVNVTRWIDEAQLIVIAVGPSPGLAWEATILQKRGLLAKSIFVIPPLPQRQLGKMWSPFIGHFISGPLTVRAAALYAQPFQF